MSRQKQDATRKPYPIRLSDEERSRLTKIAHKMGVTPPDLIRMWIHGDYEDLESPAAASAPRRVGDGPRIKVPPSRLVKQQ